MWWRTTASRRARRSSEPSSSSVPRAWSSHAASHATERAEQVALPRDARARAAAPTARRRRRRTRAPRRGGSRPPGEQPAAQQVGEVAEHDAAGADVHRVGRPGEPGADAADRILIAVTYDEPPDAAEAMAPPMMRNGSELAIRCPNPPWRNGAHRSRRGRRASRGTIPKRSRSPSSAVSTTSSTHITASSTHTGRSGMTSRRPRGRSRSSAIAAIVAARRSRPRPAMMGP